MILDIPLIADLEFIRQNQQQLIDQQLIKQNLKRFLYDYIIGEKI